MVKKKVIFDNDAAADDVAAICALLGLSDKVEIVAVTVTGTGEAHGEAGALTMANVFHMAGKGDTPIAYGSENPLSDDGKPFPDFLREFADAFSTSEHFPKHPNPSFGNSAVDLLEATIEASDEPITILATGPLTNIAELIRRRPIEENPAFYSKIENIVIMGGAVDVEGNIRNLEPTSENIYAEWNFYADPRAAFEVFESSIPITLVPLDATDHVPLTHEFLKKIAEETSPAFKFLHYALKYIIDLPSYGVEKFLEAYRLWDPLAALVLLDPEIATKEERSLSIDVALARVIERDPSMDPVRKILVATGVPHPEEVLESFYQAMKKLDPAVEPESVLDSPSAHWSPPPSPRHSKEKTAEATMQ
jgi:inosine-uridine nucleoside N-ribohydrolase